MSASSASTKPTTPPTPSAPYQDLLSGKSAAFELLDQLEALEKLGVSEGTLAER